MENATRKDGYPWPSLLELNDENGVWRKNGTGNGGGAMFLIDRDGTILSTSTDAEELEPIIKINTYFLAGIGKMWYLCGENGIKTCR